MTRNDVQNNQYLITAVEAAVSAGNIVKSYFFNKNYKVSVKQDKSFQTTADINSEKEIIKIIKKKFPHHCIDSEEQNEIIGENSNYKWLVDPLDGTDNFVLGIPHFSVSICLHYKESLILGVLYNPIIGELYTAEKGKGTKLNNKLVKSTQNKTKNLETVFFIPNGITKYESRTLILREVLYRNTRRMLDTWSPSLDWCLVAKGKADALVIIENSSVKLETGFLVLQEAGGIITDFNNNPITTENNGCIVASNNLNCHKVLINHINSVLSSLI